MAENGDCAACPSGTYSDAGAMTCTTVQAKYYATGCDENGTACTGQEKCKRGHYCTDGVIFACPDQRAHWRTTFPDYYYENPVVVSSATHTEKGEAGDITECRIIAQIDTDRGTVSDYARYNPETDEYDISSFYLWSAVKPGYYLTNANACGSYAYYRKLLECPAGSYCPGKEHVVCNAANKDEVLTPTFGLEKCPRDTYNDTTGATSADACVACPAPATHKRTTFPDNYYNPTITDIIITATPGKDSISACYILAWMQSERGKLYEYAGYNTDTGKYDKSGTYNWLAAAPGYYLAQPSDCTGWAYYKTVAKCPAGSYCPGKEPVACNAENKDEVLTETFGLETCPAGRYSDAGAAECTWCPDNTYSDAGASSCSACPTGTGNSGGHIGATSCMPLCTGGLTKLNVAGRKFNLWPRDRRTSPALCTDVNDNVCCVNMAPGNGPGINVELHNQVYHTTN